MSKRIKEITKERYAAVARAIRSNRAGSCCATGGCCGPRSYTPEETAGLPQDLVLASLGCGNPTTPADLKEGEVVLDLGCGAGLDVLLSAKRVGPKGKVYGLDMTDEMLTLAKEYQQRTGLSNVEFLRGEMEDIPLPDNSVDVIISNCVINLVPDKIRVFREAFRILKPGGRLAVSDMILLRPVPEHLRHDVELWTSCIAGALIEEEYRSMLEAAGFVDVEVRTAQTLGSENLLDGLSSVELVERVMPYADNLARGFVRARKP